MAFRSVKEFLDLGGSLAPTPAERAVIRAVQMGERCVLGDAMPIVATPENKVRAGLLRLLITGGTPECGVSPLGVSLKAAWIVGVLDLRCARALGVTQFMSCHFEAKPRFEMADCESLAFNNSHLPGLSATGLRLRGDLHLMDLHSTDTVDLGGAHIGGQMGCNGARFELADHNDQRLAINAQRLHVSHGLFWWDVAVPHGCLTLAWAKVGELVDDGKWPIRRHTLDLDGFVYDRIGGDRAPLTADGRRDWLTAGATWEGRFYPQPYTQMARVFRSMGLNGEARTVLYWREREVFAQARQDVLAAPVGAADMRLGFLGREVRVAGLWAGDWLLRIIAGYGYRPLRAFGCLIVLWAIAAVLAWQVWKEGSFAPNSDVVLVSEEWQGLLAQDCVGDVVPIPCVKNPADAWSGKGQPGMDWESFSPWGYGLDLVVPVLNLGQTDAWAPSKDRGPWGKALWWGRWFLIAFGWIVTAIGAAAVTGIMQKDRE